MWYVAVFSFLAVEQINLTNNNNILWKCQLFLVLIAEQKSTVMVIKEKYGVAFYRQYAIVFQELRKIHIHLCLEII